MNIKYITTFTVAVLSTSFSYFEDQVMFSKYSIGRFFDMAGYRATRGLGIFASGNVGAVKVEINLDAMKVTGLVSPMSYAGLHKRYSWDMNLDKYPEFISNLQAPTNETLEDNKFIISSTSNKFLNFSEILEEFNSNLIISGMFKLSESGSLSISAGIETMFSINYVKDAGSNPYNVFIYGRVKDLTSDPYFPILKLNPELQNTLKGIYYYKRDSYTFTYAGQDYYTNYQFIDLAENIPEDFSKALSYDIVEKPICEVIEKYLKATLAFGPKINAFINFSRFQAYLNCSALISLLTKDITSVKSIGLNLKIYKKENENYVSLNSKTPISMYSYTENLNVDISFIFRCETGICIYSSSGVSFGVGAAFEGSSFGIYGDKKILRLANDMESTLSPVEEEVTNMTNIYSLYAKISLFISAGYVYA